ncbi:MAG: hypothetical protein M1541_04840 [Acidobacteria bacterium]|nr:hypothetical protein [Acidobacteriota bacterium]
MTKKKNPAAVELGRLGGQARVPKGFSSDPARASDAGRAGMQARWDAYYAAHPEKLREKQEKEARKRAKTKRKAKK